MHIFQTGIVFSSVICEKYNDRHSPPPENIITSVPFIKSDNPEVYGKKSRCYIVETGGK